MLQSDDIQAKEEETDSRKCRTAILTRLTNIAGQKFDNNYLRELADLQGLCQETSAKMAYAILAKDCGPLVLQNFTDQE